MAMHGKGLIQITVKLDGEVVDIVGHEVVEYGLIGPATIGGLLDMMYAKYPKLAGKSSLLEFSVDGEPADVTGELAEGCIVAVGLRTGGI